MIAQHLRYTPRGDRRTGVRAWQAGIIGVAMALAALVASTPAVAADLIEARNTSQTFETPAPGHSVEWTMEAENLSLEVLEVRLDVNEISGSATVGEASLTLSLEHPDGAVLASGTARELAGLTFSLDPVNPGGTAEVLARVALPAAAGDDYRGSDARMRFDFVVTAEGTGGPGDLSATGSDVWLAAFIALLAIVGGLLFLLPKRSKIERGMK